MARSSTPPNPFFAAADVIGSSKDFLPDKPRIEEIKAMAATYNLEWKLRTNKLIKSYFDPRNVSAKGRHDPSFLNPAIRQEQYQSALAKEKKDFLSQPEIQNFLNTYGGGWQAALLETDPKAFENLTKIGIEQTNDARKLVIEGGKETPFSGEYEIYVGDDGRDHVALSRPLEHFFGPYIRYVYGVVANVEEPETIEEYYDTKWSNYVMKNAEEQGAAIHNLYRATQDTISPAKKQGIYRKLKPKVIESANNDFLGLQTHLRTISSEHDAEIQSLAKNFDSRSDEANFRRESLRQAINAQYLAFINDIEEKRIKHLVYAEKLADAFPDGAYQKFIDARTDRLITIANTSRETLNDILNNLDNTDKYEALRKRWTQQQLETNAVVGASNGAVTTAVNDFYKANIGMAVLKDYGVMDMIMLQELMENPGYLQDLMIYGPQAAIRQFNQKQNLDLIGSSLDSFSEIFKNRQYKKENFNLLDIQRMQGGAIAIEQATVGISKSIVEINELIQNREAFSQQEFSAALNEKVQLVGLTFVDLDYHLQRTGLLNKKSQALVAELPALDSLVKIHEEMGAVVQAHLGLSDAAWQEQLAEWREAYADIKKATPKVQQELLDNLQEEFEILGIPSGLLRNTGQPLRTEPESPGLLERATSTAEGLGWWIKKKGYTAFDAAHKLFFGEEEQKEGTK